MKALAPFYNKIIIKIRAPVQKIHTYPMLFCWTLLKHHDILRKLTFSLNWNITFRYHFKIAKLAKNSVFLDISKQTNLFLIKNNYYATAWM